MDPRLMLENIMTPAPYCVSPEDPVGVAKKMMDTRNVRHLPVKKGPRIFGIISERDIALSLSLAKHIVDESNLRVADVCVGDPYTVDVNERLDTVLRYMSQNRIGSALVTRNAELVGIVTTTDIFRVGAEFFGDFMDLVKVSNS